MTGETLDAWQEKHQHHRVLVEMTDGRTSAEKFPQNPTFIPN